MREDKLMKYEKITGVCNLICAFLLLVTLVMQCQPYWICSDCDTHEGVDKGVSIAEYFWLPKHHEPITDEMDDLYKEIYGNNYRDENGRKLKFQPNEIMLTALPATLGSAIGIFACVLLRKKFFVSTIPVLVGVAGISGFSSCPALMVGTTCQSYLTLSIVVTAVGAVALLLSTVLFVVHKIKTKKAKENA